MNARRLIFLTSLLLVALHLQAQFLFPTMSSRNAAMGGTYCGFNDNGLWNGSVSGLGFTECSSVGLNTRQNHLTKALTYNNLCATYVAKGRSRWLIDYTLYGNSDYNEQRISLGYGIALSEGWALGATFDYLNSQCADPHYSTQRLPSFSIGLSYRPTDEIVVAFDAYNPASVQMNTYETLRVPSRLSLGLSYRPCKSLIGTFAIEKCQQYEASLRFGFEYGYLERFFARAGFATNPSIYTFGIGYCQAHCAVDIAAQVHQVLGLTPQLSVNIIF